MLGQICSAGLATNNDSLQVQPALLSPSLDSNHPPQAVCLDIVVEGLPLGVCDVLLQVNYGDRVLFVASSKGAVWV